MKSSTIAAIASLASLASAYSPRHLHFPRGNSTTSVGGDQTTMTVTATHVSTIISCAPTVTNCPAGKPGMTSVPESDRSTMVVTDTVVLTTTVCPVSEAPHISASIISKHSSGQMPGSTITTAITPTQPTTGGAVTSSTAVPETGSQPGSTETPSMTTTTTDITSTKTITITTGSGTSASVIESVVTDTIKSTITVPCSQTNETPATQGPSTEGPGTDEPTTTVTSTSTSTRTVTITPAEPTATGPAAPGTSGGACNCPEGEAKTVTVTASAETVTVPASTVYVTAGACDATKVADDDKPAMTDMPNNSEQTSKAHDGGKNSVTTVETVVTVVPYPSSHHGNGTAAATGYARLRR